jgi:hypothetical protein
MGFCPQHPKTSLAAVRRFRGMRGQYPIPQQSLRYTATRLHYGKFRTTHGR